VLPEQVQSLHPADKAVLFSVVMAVGAIAFLQVNPAVRAPSDRTTSRRGRRHPWTLAAAPLLGAGFGTYWAAAPAVLTAVLPAAADRAKDLGVINIAYSLPLVVATIIAGAVLGLMHNYPALFALAGLASIAAGATITRVRSVG
jgi:hypothetical protein